MQFTPVKSLETVALEKQETITKTLKFELESYNFTFSKNIKFTEFRNMVEKNVLKDHRKIPSLLFVLNDGDYIEVVDEVSWRLLLKKPNLDTFVLNLKNNTEDLLSQTIDTSKTIPDVKQKTDTAKVEPTQEPGTLVVDDKNQSVSFDRKPKPDKVNPETPLSQNSIFSKINLNAVKAFVPSKKMSDKNKTPQNPRLNLKAKVTIDSLPR